METPLAKTTEPPLPVSGNNHCPFVRALVAAGRRADGTECIGKVAQVIADTARHGESRPAFARAAIAGIALLANGLSPAALLKTKLKGLRLNALRGGPLDKKGVGSGILDAHGKVDAAQLAKLREFATKQTAADGCGELGLGLP
jgi:Flp pilus assembly CpaE family ATPase